MAGTSESRSDPTLRCCFSQYTAEMTLLCKIQKSEGFQSGAVSVLFDVDPLIDLELRFRIVTSAVRKTIGSLSI